MERMFSNLDWKFHEIFEGGSDCVAMNWKAIMHGVVISIGVCSVFIFRSPFSRRHMFQEDFIEF